MNIIKFFNEIGLDVALLIAGLSGGLVSLRKDEKLTTWQKFLTVVSGGLIATYLTPLFIYFVTKMFGAEMVEGTKIEYGLSFIVGYMGLKAIEFLITKITKTRNNESNTSD